MNILIVSYAYAPSLSPRAIRWSSIVCQWAAGGASIDIVTAPGPGLPAVETSGTVAIHRVGGIGLENWRSRLGTTGRVDLQASATASPHANGLRRAARFVYERTWKRLYWPDYACLWYFPARRKVRNLLSARRYDAMVTVAAPFTGHLVGLSCRKHAGHATWLADYGDPFCYLTITPTNNHALYRRLNYRVERALFGAVDRVTVTTQRTADCYASLFPEQAAKLYVVPPILTESFGEPRTMPDKSPADVGKLRLAYVGRFNPPNRVPGPMVDLLLRLLRDHADLRERLEFHVYGTVAPFEALFGRFNEFPGVLHLHGLVDRSAARDALHDSDVFVNLGNLADYQLPSKLVEYVAAAKPIINFLVIQNDSSREFLRDHPACLNVLLQESINSEALTEITGFLRRAGTMRIDAAWVADFVAAHRSERIAQSYSELLAMPNPT